MNFVKENFCYHNGYLTYNGARFVARFKYGAQKGRKAKFVKFLIENFTVEEYFAAYDAGKAPLQILEEKGFSIA